MKNGNYADNLGFLTNIPAQAESILHSLEQAAEWLVSTRSQVKWNSCFFKQKRYVSILSSKILKLVDQFTYFGCNILSTESAVSILMDKVLGAFDKLSMKWKSGLSV